MQCLQVTLLHMNIYLLLLIIARCVNGEVSLPLSNEDGVLENAFISIPLLKQEKALSRIRPLFRDSPLGFNDHRYMSDNYLQENSYDDGNSPVDEQLESFFNTYLEYMEDELLPTWGQDLVVRSRQNLDIDSNPNTLDSVMVNGNEGLDEKSYKNIVSDKRRQDDKLYRIVNEYFHGRTNQRDVIGGINNGKPFTRWDADDNIRGSSNNNSGRRGDDNSQRPGIELSQADMDYTHIPLMVYSDEDMYSDETRDSGEDIIGESVEKRWLGGRGGQAVGGGQAISDIPRVAIQYVEPNQADVKDLTRQHASMLRKLPRQKLQRLITEAKQMLAANSNDKLSVDNPSDNKNWDRGATTESPRAKSGPGHQISLGLDLRVLTNMVKGHSQRRKTEKALRTAREKLFSIGR